MLDWSKSIQRKKVVHVKENYEDKLFKNLQNLKKVVTRRPRRKRSYMPEMKNMTTLDAPVDELHRKVALMKSAYYI